MKNWSNEFPGAAGKFWFYGSPWHGSSGSDYDDDNKIKPELYFVEIKQPSKGFLCVVSGNFMKSTPFNKAQQKVGFCGYWKAVNEIELPKDELNLFS